ncbi:MAG: hypothetical protein KAG61_00215 [Bacteriovoracaceae bacterium]|nr:hypothetical protein [Bacteriovoracaceae bacterium]
MKRIFLVFMLLFAGCSKVRTINLEPHTFSSRPNHIVWIQVAGLDEEHLAMIRFSKNSANIKTALENSQCVGSMWSYNLFKLRPSSELSFLSQLNGRKNLDGTCKDYDLKPLWSYTDRLDYTAGIFESQTSGDDLYKKTLDCKKNSEYFDSTYFWKMGKAPNKAKANFYNQMDKTPFSKGGVFYDDSCQTGVCYTTLEGNVSSVYRRFAEGKGKTLFIVRDFTYENALKSRNYPRARELLVALDKMYGDFTQYGKEKGKTLILLTSGAARNLELPQRGSEWEQFDLNGKSIVFKNRALISPVFAHGSGAENFCGMFEESEIMKRILWVPSQSQLEEDIKSIFR